MQSSDERNTLQLGVFKVIQTGILVLNNSIINSTINRLTTNGRATIKEEDTQEE